MKVRKVLNFAHFSVTYLMSGPLMKNKNEGTELIVTGHEYKGIPIDALRDAADYISYLEKEKHLFDNSFYARKVIEF